MASELEVFILVVQHGGFTGAARQLRLTPSAISRRIALLEGRLGVQLLSRTTRKVELTAAGESYYRRIEPLLSAIATASQDLNKLTPIPVGRLVISAPAALLERKLVGFVAEFLELNPRMRIELVPSEIDSSTECDFLLQSFASLDKNKVSMRLAANPWTVCAAPAYLRKCSGPSHPTDLYRHDCLIIRRHPHWQFFIEDKELSLAPPARLISFGGAVYLAALSGLGIARLASFLVDDDIKSGRLVELLPSYAQANDRSLYLIANSEKIGSVKHTRFAEFIKAKFAE